MEEYSSQGSPEIRSGIRPEETLPRGSAGRRYASYRYYPTWQEERSPRLARVHKLTRMKLVKRGDGGRKVVNEKEGTSLSIDSYIRLSQRTKGNEGREYERSLPRERNAGNRVVLSLYFSLLSDASGNRIPDVPHSRLVTHLSFTGV